MAKNQTGAPTSTFVTPGVTFGTSLEYQLLGTYSTAPFMQICNDVASHCHCNLTFLPDLCKPTDPMQAHFHIAYAQFDMVGPSDIDRTSLAHQLNILIVQNKTTDFDHSATPSRQIDLFEKSQTEDDSDDDTCFALNVSGHFLQRWELHDITCLMYIFTEKDKDLPTFTEHFRQVIPYFHPCSFSMASPSSHNATSCWICFPEALFFRKNHYYHKLINNEKNFLLHPALLLWSRHVRSKQWH